MAGQPTPPPDDTRARLERLERIAQEALDRRSEQSEQADRSDQPATRPVDQHRSGGREHRDEYRDEYSGDGGGLFTLICALVFLYFGYTRRGVTALRGSELYAWSLQAFPWVCMTTGALLLLAALLAFARIRAGLAVEVLASALATLMCFVFGMIWMLDGDNEGFLLLIFALVNGYATKNTLLAWRRK